MSAHIDACNVCWTKPSTDASGSMPIGNGQVGLNVWTEPDGDLCFFIARDDAWSETSRLLKLGKVRLRLTPNPWPSGTRFRQTLVLRDGRIEITAGSGRRAVPLSIFVDIAHPIIHVSAVGARPFTLRAGIEPWRTERHVLKDAELESSWTMHHAPMEVAEDPDVVVADSGSDVSWYHRNTHSVWGQTLEHQNLQEFLTKETDPLLHRTFGGVMRGRGLTKQDDRTLISSSRRRRFSLSIAAHTAQTPTPEAWIRQTKKLLASAPARAAAAAATRRWWRDFWKRSYLFLSARGPQRAVVADINRAYALQRWITACTGRGTFPIKFNGSLFTVEPRYTTGLHGAPGALFAVATSTTPGLPYDADYRRWGDCYWWQNTRLGYQPMLARGEFDLMKPFWSWFERLLPMCVRRTALYHQCAGVYFPETITFFGAHSNGDYGWNRAGLAPGDLSPSPWWQFVWNPGLELVMMMLDYYDHTRERAFLRRHLIPMASQVLAYFDTRFGRDAAGRLLIQPTQILETYRYGVINDTPCVAGLHAVLERVERLPSVPPALRSTWKRLRGELPELPLATDAAGSFIPPAQTYEPRRENCENPELYAIYPFRLISVNRGDLELGRATYLRRQERNPVGWSQDGINAALLGLTDEAQRIVLHNVKVTHPGHRFPIMWGPNYDWLPDQDHGANFTATLQLMALQADAGKIHLLPAWPREWDVRFKLHAPNRTTVEVDYRNGKMRRVRISPRR